MTGNVGAGSPGGTSITAADIAAGEEYRAARKLRGLKQEELAVEVGTSKRTLSRIESGFVASPTAQTLERVLADELTRVRMQRSVDATSAEAALEVPGESGLVWELLAGLARHFSVLERQVLAQGGTPVAARGVSELLTELARRSAQLEAQLSEGAPPSSATADEQAAEWRLSDAPSAQRKPDGS